MRSSQLRYNAAQSGRANAAMHASGTGGRLTTMGVGMATVAVGLGAFFYMQMAKVSHDPNTMPTWQYRHALQAPEHMSRTSSPGGTQTSVRNSKEPTQYLPTNPVGTTSKHSGGQSGSGLVQTSAPADTGKPRGSAGAYEDGNEEPSTGKGSQVGSGQNGSNNIGRNDRGIVSSVLTKLHGDPKQEDQSRYQGQPAQSTRLNDRGGQYTKNSDFKDSYRRD
ncbi:hypothetical protein DICSQDRAFT_171930 [Dichomitus squalens LYAD-421 SS1]|uniref:Uncharacterized protein n=1 Tax=Dichomitus squalens (strain LYAD-421) TaxID=732165 RepID=R7SUS5_DICSQ|nr:uncharacterized protein DICSQDRAFT_171930 [Dichomitus squalens LYAD-421 SS1]EJF59530.1 hypothetical protein DICSQDRAFT_171930 [Dichomitus squalens LYAD-421 SS1]